MSFSFKIPGQPGALVLQDKDGKPGKVFTGYLRGAEVTAKKILEQSQKGRDFAYGECVFNTSMTGYQEILTDPSYFGQLVCMTYPHIGNTGTNSEDEESQGLHGAGLIVQEFSRTTSSWRNETGLDEYLQQHDVPAMSRVDTRALTQHLRSNGVTRGILLPEAEVSRAQELLAELPPFEGRDLIQEVATQEAYLWKGNPKDPKFKVVAIDFGAKWNLFRSLAGLGCAIEVVPPSETPDAILARKPDGVFLSNGPGDPEMVPYAVKTVKEVLGQVPIFGVCMGHQILAQAIEGKTYKLKFGHRGGNQPVRDEISGRVEITSQNHGYAVATEGLGSDVQITHLNLNDQSVEGLAIPSKKAFSVQHHPEACPGPHDSAPMFEKFIESMGG